MTLDQLPNSAYEMLMDRLIYADEEELRDLDLPEDRVKYILNGGEPDYRDMEIAFSGYDFIEDDFGLTSEMEIKDKVFDTFEKFLNKYELPEISNMLYSKEADELIDSIATILFMNQ